MSIFSVLYCIYDYISLWCLGCDYSTRIKLSWKGSTCRILPQRKSCVRRNSRSLRIRSSERSRWRMLIHLYSSEYLCHMESERARISFRGYFLLNMFFSVCGHCNDLRLAQKKLFHTVVIFTMLLRRIDPYVINNDPQRYQRWPNGVVNFILPPNEYSKSLLKLANQ